jgi:NSS family neurotransmitter:Na+ symporter
LISALRMPGAGDALRFIFVPDLATFKASSALEALGHAFFTLSLGMGAMITYGSYLRRKDSVVSSALAVVILDTCIALLATIIMFCIIFSVPGLRDSIGRSTVGMLFITLPEQIYTALPAGRLLGPLFYILVAFAALTSTISMLEVIVSWMIDERGMSRTKATLVGGGGTVVVSILSALSLGAMGGLSSFEIFPGKGGVLSTLDHLASNWLLPIGGFVLTIAVGWFMSRQDTYRELVDEHTPNWFQYGMWRFFVMVVAPIAVGTIIGFVVFAGRDFS